MDVFVHFLFNARTHTLNCLLVQCYTQKKKKLSHSENDDLFTSRNLTNLAMFCWFFFSRLFFPTSFTDVQSEWIFSLDLNLLLQERFVFWSFHLCLFHVICCFRWRKIKAIHNVSFYCHLNCRKKKKTEQSHSTTIQVSTGYFRVQNWI